MTVKMYIDWDKMRNTCISRQWYTSGTNAEYEALYDFIESINRETSAFWHKPNKRKTWTEKNVLKVAENILNHSKPNNINSVIEENDRNELLAMILWEIYNNIAYYCVSMDE